MTERIVDAWMQHPTARHLNHEMFDSLRRWTGDAFTGELPLDLTIGAMDEGGVAVGLTAARDGPEGALVDNDEVAALAAGNADRVFAITG